MRYLQMQSSGNADGLSVQQICQKERPLNEDRAVYSPLTPTREAVTSVAGGWGGRLHSGRVSDQSCMEERGTVGALSDSKAFTPKLFYLSQPLISFSYSNFAFPAETFAPAAQ